MPSLFILAGANGSGKTTFYSSAREKSFIDPAIPFINVDIIAKELGDYTVENFERANHIYRERVSLHLLNMEDFMIESNLSKTADYDWIENMIKKGYEIILFFFGTADVQINIKRVETRIIEGGHSVPENIIRDRFAMGMLYLKSKLHLFKEVYLIDNSNQTKVIAVIQNNKIEYRENEIPSWVSKLLFLLQKINDKGK